MIPLWLGQYDYIKAAKLQDAVFDTVLGLEHPLTITLGRRADPLKDIKVSIRVIKDRNVPIINVERGGQATIHGPGQLVIYPVIHLGHLGLRVRDYLKILEESTRRTLSLFGVETSCRAGEPGLYTPEGKIAFFGVRIQRGVTSHGVAINVCNDLQDFSLIRSCGIEKETFSRVIDYGQPATCKDIFQVWFSEFQDLCGAPSDLTEIATPPMVNESNDLRV